MIMRLLPPECLPAPHDLDDAPQLAAVAVLWFALHTIERALLAAHPALIGDDPVDAEEHLAAAVLSLASVLRTALDQYRVALEAALDSTHGRVVSAPKPGDKSDDIPF